MAPTPQGSGCLAGAFNGDSLKLWFLLQVVDEIVQMLTEEKFKSKMVVILAGYEEQVDNLMAVNPGQCACMSVQTQGHLQPCRCM
jgi:hypothetical protein